MPKKILPPERSLLTRELTPRIARGINEAAELLSVHPDTVRNLIRKGAPDGLNTIRIGDGKRARVLILDDELHRFIRRAELAAARHRRERQPDQETINGAFRLLAAYLIDPTLRHRLQREAEDPTTPLGAAVAVERARDSAVDRSAEPPESDNTVAPLDDENPSR